MHDALLRALDGARSVLLTATQGLDGDAVGAIVALHHAIGRRWPGVELVVVTDEALPDNCVELAREVEWGAAKQAPRPVDVAFVVDGGADRLGAAERHFAEAALKVQVDHHRSADGAGVDLCFLDTSAASTTQLVLTLCDRWGVELDERLAEAIYTGLVFDTGGFRFAMTSPATLRAAARCLEAGIDHSGIIERLLLVQPTEKVRLRGRVLDRMRVAAGGRLAWSSVGMEDAGIDVGGIVDDLVFIEGVEVGALLSERAGARVKVSLRSRGKVDVAALAGRLSARGGGHFRAAGATVEGALEEVVERLLPLVEASLP